MDFAAAGSYAQGVNLENRVITTANTALKLNLKGQGGDNVLNIASGDDALVGGLGKDMLSGGTGATTLCLMPRSAPPTLIA